MWLSYFQSEKSWLGPSSIRTGTLKHSNWECFVNAKLAWNGLWWIRVTCLYTHPAVTKYSSLEHWAVLQPGLSHFTLPSVFTGGTSEPCGGSGRPCLILTQSYLSNRVHVWSSPMNSHLKQTYSVNMTSSQPITTSVVKCYSGIFYTHFLFQPWRTHAVRWPVALAAPASSHPTVCPPSACVLWVVRTSPSTWCAAATAWTTKANVSSTWKPAPLRRTSACITKAAAVSLCSL